MSSGNQSVKKSGEVLSLRVLSLMVRCMLLVVSLPSVSVHAEVLQMEYSDRTRILPGAICLTARNDFSARTARLNEAERAAARVDEVCQFRADILVGGESQRQTRSIEVGATEAMPFGQEREVCLDARWQLQDSEKVLEVIGIGYRCFSAADHARLVAKSNPPPLRRSEVMSYLQRPAYAAILNMPFLSGY